jgi:dihydroorotate dehydrogenase
LLKIAPDLTEEQLQDICALAMELKLDGLVATNTTISREELSPISAQQASKIGAGGLSGRPLRERSNEVLRFLHKHTEGKIPLVGSGGVFTSKDATSKLEAGATLVQVWTGFIYEGPGIVKKICSGLAKAGSRWQVAGGKNTLWLLLIGIYIYTQFSIWSTYSILTH